MLCALTANAQLLINEVSQGASGAKEYVEFVVVGNFKCDPNQNCVDLRNWYLDDNNGYHSASTSGSGIANGSLRLTNHPIWSCVPIGTLLLIYNGSDMPVNMPATDTSLNDGNCRLVIPIDSTKSGICRFIVKNNQFPNQTNPTYPAGGFSSCPTGPSWTVVGMANGNDSYHTVTATGTIVHAVSWGNNNLNTNIYFSGSAGGLVYAMENIVNNDPYNQANWTSKSATTAETPGLPNSTANANWINYLTNHCSPRTPFLAAFSGLS
ncbi:MAG: hypothetical protein IT239_00545, partial [Bacteroidia bacterium]|nr:hypothetical protein [Bacteroidia bacterium]